MKKNYVILLCLTLVCLLVSGCGTNSSEAVTSSSESNGLFIEPDLKNYGDVHVTEKEVELETYNVLVQKVSEEVESCLNYPKTADFGALNWAVGRSDDKYMIVGKVTAENGFGVKDDASFTVWFIANGDAFTTEGVAINGVRVK